MKPILAFSHPSLTLTTGPDHRRFVFLSPPFTATIFSADPMESQVTTNQTGPFWTDEKHLHFLNSIETSFVRTMLQNSNNTNLSRCSHHLLRLDRYLPDSSESTLDLQCSHRRTRKQTLSGSMGPRKRMDGRRLRRRSSEAYNSSQDQVVPQVEDDGAEGGSDQVQRNNV